MLRKEEFYILIGAIALVAAFFFSKGVGTVVQTINNLPNLASQAGGDLLNSMETGAMDQVSTALPPTSSTYDVLSGAGYEGVMY